MSSSSDNNTLLSIHASITGLRVCSFIKLLSVKVLYIYISIYTYILEKSLKFRINIQSYSASSENKKIHDF